jgi:hypothetical protein
VCPEAAGKGQIPDSCKKDLQGQGGQEKMNESEMKVRILDLEERVSKLEDPVTRTDNAFEKAAVELEELNTGDTTESEE